MTETMRCTECGGTFIEKHGTLHAKYGGIEFDVPDMHYSECDGCGDHLYPAGECKKIERVYDEIVIPYRFFPSFWRHPMLFMRIFFERATKGYAAWDVWDLDRYLSWMIHRALRDFKKRYMGVPVNMTEEEWDALLDKMRDAWLNLYVWDDVLYQMDGGTPEYRKALDDCAKNIERAKQDAKLLIEHIGDLWL